jgi:hypothetical protein
MMPNVAVYVYCSCKVKGLEKSVNVPIDRAALPTWRVPKRMRTEPPLRRRCLARVKSFGPAAGRSRG